MATRTQKLGIGGIVVDGRVRDLQYIRSLELPVDSPGVLWSGDLIIGFC
jgi:regulator of RNase E activity RraA